MFSHRAKPPSSRNRFPCLRNNESSDCLRPSLYHATTEKLVINMTGSLKIGIHTSPCAPRKTNARHWRRPVMINQRQQHVIEYLVEENRVLPEQIGKRRMRFINR